jgi:hypothetical protein
MPRLKKMLIRVCGMSYHEITQPPHEGFHVLCNVGFAPQASEVMGGQGFFASPAAAAYAGCWDASRIA